MKEKLIELFKHDDCPLFMVFGDNMDALADFLIANGVTVQKWIPVTERLPHFYPKKRQKVLVTLEDNFGKRFTTTAKYNEENEYWYEFADCRYTDFKVLAWMEKPDPYEPPKE